MEIVSEWATRIAREVAPDEVGNAPEVARSYVEGGRLRDAVFKTPTRPTTRSLFGPDTVATGVAILPYVFDAIQYVGTELTQVLGAFGGTAAHVGAEAGAASGGVDAVTAGGLPDLSNVASNTTGAAYYVIGAIGTILTLRGRKERTQKKEELIDDEGVKDVHARLTEEIAKIPNINEDQADLITYRVLKVMLEDPSGAVAFTRQVTD